MTVWLVLVACGSNEVEGWIVHGVFSTEAAAVAYQAALPVEDRPPFSKVEPFAIDALSERPVGVEEQAR